MHVILKFIHLNNETLIKGSLIFGGGFLLFLLLKPKDGVKLISPTKKFDEGSKPPSEKDLANAEIVATAYSEALKAGEPATRLTELNKECMKEFGLRCYMEKGGKLVVSDTSGNTVLSK